MVAMMLSSASRAGATSRRVCLTVRAQSGMQQKTSAVKNVDVNTVIKPAAVTLISNIIMAMPACAEGGKLFDFNLTLPIMAGQFLLLMVFLDKFWFGPVGKVLDERDELIRNKLSSVRDNASELRSLQEEAERIVKEARSEVQAKINEIKRQTEAEQNEKLNALRAKIDRELEDALSALDKEKDTALKSLDSQVDKLSQEILSRVLPEGMKL